MQQFDGQVMCGTMPESTSDADEETSVRVLGFRV